MIELTLKDLEAVARNRQQRQLVRLSLPWLVVTATAYVSFMLVSNIWFELVASFIVLCGILGLTRILFRFDKQVKAQAKEWLKER